MRTDPLPQYDNEWMDGWVIPHSEGSRQGLVTPPVLRQAAAEEVRAVGLYQASGRRCAALLWGPHLLVVQLAVGG